MTDTGWINFFKSTFKTWLKYVLFYSALLIAMLALPAFMNGDWNRLRIDFESPVVLAAPSLIAVMSLWIGWASATHRHSMPGSVGKLLRVGVVVTTIIIMSALSMFLFTIGQFSISAILVFAIFFGFVSAILVYWSYFILGIWGEWWW